MKRVNNVVGCLYFIGKCELVNQKFNDAVSALNIKRIHVVQLATECSRFQTDSRHIECGESQANL